MKRIILALLLAPWFSPQILEAQPEQSEKSLKEHAEKASPKFDPESDPEELFVTVFEDAYPHATGAEAAIAREAFRESLVRYVQLLSGNTTFPGQMTNKISIAHPPHEDTALQNEGRDNTSITTNQAKKQEKSELTQSTKSSNKKAQKTVKESLKHSEKQDTSTTQKSSTTKQPVRKDKQKQKKETPKKENLQKNDNINQPQETDNDNQKRKTQKIEPVNTSKTNKKEKVLVGPPA